jgi:hypothetical protein
MNTKRLLLALIAVINIFAFSASAASMDVDEDETITIDGASIIAGQRVFQHGFGGGKISISMASNIDFWVNFINEKIAHSLRRSITKDDVVDVSLVANVHFAGDADWTKLALHDPAAAQEQMRAVQREVDRIGFWPHGARKALTYVRLTLRDGSILKNLYGPN